jgi:hypothetical protein
MPLGSIAEIEKQIGFYKPADWCKISQTFNQVKNLKDDKTNLKINKL